MSSACETNVPQTPKPTYRQSKLAPMLSALTANPANHPERSNATLARVTEVIDIVCNGTSGALVSGCLAAAGSDHNPLDPISETTAEAVGGVMVEGLGQNQLAQAIELLWQSELSTDEVIALHRK